MTRVLTLEDGEAANKRLDDADMPQGDLVLPLEGHPIPNSAQKVRKPRADKGVPHKQEPKKKGRRKPVFHIFRENPSTKTGTLVGPFTRAELEAQLNEAAPMVVSHVIAGPEIQYVRKVQYSFKV